MKKIEKTIDIPLNEWYYNIKIKKNTQKGMVNMTKTEMKQRVLEEAGLYNVTEEDVKHYEDCNYLTETLDKNGNEVIWYSDCDGLEAAMIVTTEEFLIKEELEALI